MIAATLSQTGVAGLAASAAASLPKSARFSAQIDQIGIDSPVKQTSFLGHESRAAEGVGSLRLTLLDGL